MKKNSLILASAILATTFFACGGGNKKVEEQEKQAVETQVAKDQVAMDSLEKAIKAQIDAVDDDSLMKVNH
jgi:outer membrane murein-binding lipoprotein Lpp